MSTELSHAIIMLIQAVIMLIQVFIHQKQSAVVAHLGNMQNDAKTGKEGPI